MTTTLVDLTDVETRQTKDGYELKCPVCLEWVKSLLATEAGTMCAGCWKRRQEKMS